MIALQEYGSDDSEPELGSDALTEDHYLHLQKPSTSTAAVGAIVKLPELTPAIANKEAVGGVDVIDPTTRELDFNPKFEQLFAPVAGPSNPYKTQQMSAEKNTLSGFAEEAQVNLFQFEKERRTFDSYGYAIDPSATSRGETAYVGDKVAAEEKDGQTVFETTKTPREFDKRKRIRNLDSGDVEGYTGPWGGYVDEIKVSKPDEETLKVMDAYTAKRRKFSRRHNKGNAAAEDAKDDHSNEKFKLHITDPYDYQGRSFLHAPHDVGVNLRTDEPPAKCFIPKKLLHTWTGHKKAVQALRWFPKTAHLLLSAGMDGTCKLWEAYRDRRCVATYNGHLQAVRDIQFNNDGSQFISTSYDKYIKVWDTETGEVKTRLTTGKVPFCVRYNPDEDKQHMILTGMGDKKIIQWDLRSGETVQEYDRHLGAVNTITFFDENRRFCTTSDDKSMRIWEWEIPVDTKLIQDASMHSMPAVTPSPNKKWLAAQSMDNRVIIFQIIDEKVRFSRKKTFKGHNVSGYACCPDFSPDMSRPTFDWSRDRDSYLISGDADGRVWVWDWKTHKTLAKWKAHEQPCIDVKWNPHETSKVATAGWDGLIHYWD